MNSIKTGQGQIPSSPLPITKKYRKITLEMILSSTSLTRSSKETHETYLARVTHLHLQSKRIKYIEGLELCTNLKVLYLYDNQIENIQNLEFASILQYLYLQNNYLKELPMFTMSSLRKLFLDENEIKYVTGLSACKNLEELHVPRQRLQTFSCLEFDPESLHAISHSLQVLEISSNGVSRLNQFTVLYNLRKFVCKDNAVVDLSEVQSIVSLPNLEEADFSGNPCATLMKYRDITIGAASDIFSVLDEVPIPKHQQVAIKGLMAHRRKIGAISRYQPSTSTNSYEPQEVELSEEL